MKKLFILVFASAFLFSSCEFLEENLPAGLSEEEIVEGLKTALTLGADSATTTLHQTNGYYLDEAVKILLPPEASIITTNLSKVASYIPGGSDFINAELDKLVRSINMAAEDAADDALPILADAVTNLSITDAWSILNGAAPSGMKSANSEFDSLAATHYLEQETKSDLIIAFSEPINVSLDKPFIGNTSTNDIWSNITEYYNDAAEIYNLIPLVSDLEYVNTNLGEYATEKALNGLFLKVGEEEKKIRRNPFEWAIDIIQKVFGSLSE
ncbi:MAG: DUF4197 domain-containing protein [Bacteroidota bacterium]|nr:MAG: DUF4197 domain-containing protein [Bacteroidota bacterium]